MTTEQPPSLRQDGDSFDSGATIDRVAQKAHEAIDQVAAKAKPAVERVQTAASQAATLLQEKSEALADWEDEWLDKTRSHIREQPLTAVAIGLLAGVVLSRLSR